MMRRSNPRGRKRRGKTSRANRLPSIGSSPAMICRVGSRKSGVSRHPAAVGAAPSGWNGGRPKPKELDRRCGNSGLQRTGPRQPRPSGNGGSKSRFPLRSALGGPAPPARPPPSSRLHIGHAGMDIRSGGNRHPVAPRVIHSGVVHHRQHVVERGHPPRSRRRHDAIAPRLSRPLRSAAARPATTPHERLISLCKSLNCNGQNQTAEKNSLHETPSWLVAGLMPRTETPPPISEGRAWKVRAGASLAQPEVSRPTAGLARVRLARARTKNLY